MIACRHVSDMDVVIAFGNIYVTNFGIYQFEV